jgi:hypothetical protein
MVKLRRMSWAGHVARVEYIRNAYKILVGYSEVKKPSGRPKRKCKDNIKMDLRKMGFGVCGLNSYGSGQGPVTGCCGHGNEPRVSYNTGNVLTS